MHKWTIVSETDTLYYFNGPTDTLVYAGQPGDYMEFKTNGTVVYSSTRKNYSSAYSFDADKMVVTIDPLHYAVQELTDSSCILYECCYKMGSHDRLRYKITLKK